MFNQIVLFLHSGKVVFYTFSSVILIILVVLLIKNFINKITTNSLYKYSIAISKLQQSLWLQEKKAYYDTTKKIIIDEKGKPISLLEDKAVLTPSPFIGNVLPSQAIRIGICSFAPQKQYIFNKKLNITLHPISGTDIWKVESNLSDRIILSHPIMGELILEDTLSTIKDKKEVKIYQRATYIGKDSLIKYELRDA